MFYVPVRWRTRLQMMFLVRWTIRQSIVGCYESIGATPFSMLIMFKGRMLATAVSGFAEFVSAFASTADVARDQSPMASTWQRPPLGWVKTNSDGGSAYLS
ncbi:hypothetical protein V6N13_001258 [Hibiscus sabdariffa]|uniref:Secreted protein n=1 Tax=Hibiscus sabdariffa TaxID=183260 RepID=A0ABR2G7T5_9ROSI